METLFAFHHSRISGEACVVYRGWWRTMQARGGELIRNPTIWLYFSISPLHVTNMQSICDILGYWPSVTEVIFHAKMRTDRIYVSIPQSLQWRHNEPHDFLLSRLFRRRSKKTPKLRFTGLCVGNLLPVTGEFPAQQASSAENVSIWWHHHEGRNTVKIALVDSVRSVWILREYICIYRTF